MRFQRYNVYSVSFLLSLHVVLEIATLRKAKWFCFDGVFHCDNWLLWTVFHCMCVITSRFADRTDVSSKFWTQYLVVYVTDIMALDNSMWLIVVFTENTMSYWRLETRFNMIRKLKKKKNKKKKRNNYGVL